MSTFERRVLLACEGAALVLGGIVAGAGAPDKAAYSIALAIYFRLRRTGARS